MKKVLIMEDEVNIRSFVVINLNRAGYQAIEAGTGTEALEQLEEEPTHIFLQAGVGSMAGAMAGLFTAALKTEPTIVIVEPSKADCIFRTALPPSGHQGKPEK